MGILGFRRQNLRADSQLEVRFHHFGCFLVVFSDKLYRKDSVTPGNVAGRPSSHLTTDDTLFSMYFRCLRFLFYDNFFQTHLRHECFLESVGYRISEEQHICRMWGVDPYLVASAATRELVGIEGSHKLSRLCCVP